MAFIARIFGSVAPLPLVLVSWTLACGDAGGGSTGTTSGPGTTDTTTTTGATGSGSTAGTGEPTGSGSAGQTSSTGSTGEVTTGSTGGVATGGETTTGAATDGSTSTVGGSTGDTGGKEGGTCEKDADCTLGTDCCTCDVLAPGDQLPFCPLMECFAEKCATVDIGEPVCRFGRCTFSKIHCNPTGVICKAEPPTCGPGEVPSVNENGDCWTGLCAPVETCDWAPNCEACLVDTDPLVCVFKAQKGAYNVCEPKPASCGDAPEIDCACGQEICDASPPHTVCHDKTPGITCECPFC